MLCSLNHRQDITALEDTKLKSSLLTFEELNTRNSNLSTYSGYDNCSNINFPLHHALNQVDLNTNLLDKMILTEVILPPAKKPRSVGPHKSISKKIDNNNKACLENKKFRSANKSL